MTETLEARPSLEYAEHLAGADERGHHRMNVGYPDLASHLYQRRRANPRGEESKGLCLVDVFWEVWDPLPHCASNSFEKGAVVHHTPFGSPRADVQGLRAFFLRRVTAGRRGALAWRRGAR